MLTWAANDYDQHWLKLGDVEVACVSVCYKPEWPWTVGVHRQRSIESKLVGGHAKTLKHGKKMVEILMMEPNNIGDLLAGVFGPLAILWLILGYFQQGIELRQNTRALSLQAEELKKSSEALTLQVEEMRRSAEQQTRMAQLTADQLQFQADRLAADQAEKEAQFEPRFDIIEDVKFAENAPGIGQVKIANSGATVIVLRSNSNFGDDVLPSKRMVDWVSGVSCTFVPYREDRPKDLPVRMEVLFRQMNGRLRTLVISMEPLGNEKYGQTELLIEDATN